MPLLCPPGRHVLMAHQGALLYCIAAFIFPLLMLLPMSNNFWELLLSTWTGSHGELWITAPVTMQQRTSVLPVVFCSHQPPQKFNQTAIPKEHNSISVKILLQTDIFIAASINWKSCTAGMSETCKSVNIFSHHIRCLLDLRSKLERFVSWRELLP